MIFEADIIKYVTIQCIETNSRETVRLRTHMKRRNFIVGGSALGVISLSLTATAADFTNSVDIGADFRSVPDVVRPSLSADPNNADEPSFHLWELRNARIEQTVTEVIVEYPDGTSFDGLTDNDITIEFERPNGNFRDLKLENGEYSGSSATFVIDDSQSELIDEAIVEIDGVENPPPGSYSPDITFVTDEEEDNIYTANSAELNISSDDAFYVVEIDDAPDLVDEGDEIVVEYTVANTDGGTGSKDVVFLIDGTEQGRREHTLDVNESASDEFSYRTDSDDGSSVEAVVETEDTDDRRTIGISGWGLNVDPEENNTDAEHTWSNGFVDFNGEIETIYIEYDADTQNRPVEVDDVEIGSITVELTREEDDELTEVTVADIMASDTRNESELTIELGRTEDTSIEGELVVEVDDLEHPNDDFDGKITLIGDDEISSGWIEITL